MNFEQLEPLPAGNPFLHDASHMGTPIGTNLIIMHREHDDKEQEYVHLVNPLTGERWRWTP